MANPHYIRLLGPWTACFTDDSGVIQSSTKIRVPFESSDFHAWTNGLNPSGGNVLGSISLTRNFKWPHASNPSEQIVIEIDASFHFESIELNGNHFPLQSGSTKPLSQHLLLNNALVLKAVLPSSGEAGLSLSGARLCIGGTPQDDFNDQ